MNKRIGKFLEKNVSGEAYRVYVPQKLPPTPPIETNNFIHLLEKAAVGVSHLNRYSKSLPNASLFIYMYVRKEALLSSQIEGTQSSFSDLILFENHQKISISLEDVEEVSLYVKAIKHGIHRMSGGFPLSMRLLREVHKILLSGGRGNKMQPGSIRNSQNWIGGTRPGNALFVPPSVDYVDDLLSNLEIFLHNSQYPALLKAAIAHVQFETIHPFLDGNGRIGRLLIMLILIHEGLMDEPILYLSLYLKEKRATYYDLLQEVREKGSWETWIEFFLNGIIETSQAAINTISLIEDLFSGHQKKIESIGRARFSCLEIWEHMKKLPQVSVPYISSTLKLSQPAARKSLNHMVDLKIIEETTGKQRDKIYVYKKYLHILEEGADPI